MLRLLALSSDIWVCCAVLGLPALAQVNYRVSVFHFAPKWWSADSREFTLVFNTGDDAWNTIRGKLRLNDRAVLPGGKDRP